MTDTSISFIQLIRNLFSCVTFRRSHVRCAWTWMLRQQQQQRWEETYTKHRFRGQPNLLLIFEKYGRFIYLFIFILHESDCANVYIIMCGWCGVNSELRMRMPSKIRFWFSNRQLAPFSAFQMNLGSDAKWEKSSLRWWTRTHSAVAENWEIYFFWTVSVSSSSFSWW